MYHIIHPLEICECSKTDSPNLSTADIDWAINLLNNCNEYYILKNLYTDLFGNKLKILLSVIPSNMLLNMYHKYNFLKNRITPELLEYIIYKSSKRIFIKSGNKEDFYCELFDITNHFNEKYNFTDKYFLKRLEIVKSDIQKIVKDFNWNNYYIGGETILVLASTKFRNLCDLESVQIILYPKTYQKSQILKYKIKNYSINIYPKIITFDKIIVYLESVVYDDKLWCKLELYQQLELENENINIRPRQPINKSLTLPLQINPKRIFINCYMCGKRYDEDLSQHNKRLCLHCDKFNFGKRILTADLKGCVAFVTGIRQKIGFRVAHKLLKCGATVIGTTRYRNAALYNYAHMEDYDSWKDRLIIYKCDFLNMAEVIKMVDFLKSQKINILINNAAQTIKMPVIYYEKLNELENLLENKMLESGLKEITNIGSPILDIGSTKFNSFGDLEIDPGKNSSWNQRIDELSTSEIMETVIINQTIPLLLVNQLKNCMAKPRFIINVTAREGFFNKKKNSHHVHVNMCKAALNMMVRTLYEEKENHQYVYSINPGYVSGVYPNYDSYPLTDIDGASRILDPIIQFYNKTPLPKEKQWIFLSNYRPDIF
ncbi:MAG: dehydrogenase/oxidoreductase [Satyrvirus sp.]|uniref:Dehydrogenase/oxidoreductase n=1 Tax=Satyrvirus sp. TaxID=2487771 RepID=A0A3G5AEX8_9VIRU|nr:MAG: dehydrogenase/oxidoreductase [Satyrvirus sp.]